MLKRAFLLWKDIAIMMFFIIVVDFIVFEDLIFYWHMFFYVKEIFISIFIITILFSMFFVGYFFERHGVLIAAKNRFFMYMKIYFAILWRALIIVIPIIGVIAYIYHGSIGSRIFTIFIEILAGLGAIYWFLKKISKSVR